MKKLVVIFLLLFPLLSSAQVVPVDLLFDAWLRSGGGLGLSKNDYSNAEKALLRAKADTNQVKTLAKVQSVNGMTGNVVLTKAHVGLSAVPNTDATVPSNIGWNSSYRTITDVERSVWNAKANTGGGNSFGGRQLFSGDYVTGTGTGFDWGLVDIAPFFSPVSGSDPYRFFALRLMPDMYPPPGGLPSATKAYSLYAKGNVLLGGNIEVDSASAYTVGAANKRLSLVYADWINTNNIILNSALTTPGIRTSYNSSLGRYETTFQNSSGSRIGTVFENGNYLLGSGTTDAGYRLDVAGAFRTIGAATITNGLSVTSGTAAFSSTGTFGGNVTITNSTGTSFTLNHTSGSIPFTASHTNTSVPTFGITNTATNGWAGYRYTRDAGVIGYQFIVGGSASTLCPGCVSHQHIKGNVVFNLAESGKKFIIDATNTDGSTPVFSVDRSGVVTATTVTGLSAPSAAGDAVNYTTYTTGLASKGGLASNNSWTGANTFSTGVTLSTNAVPSLDNGYNLGSSSFRFADAHAVNVHATQVMAGVSGGDVVITKSDGTQIARFYNSSGKVKISSFANEVTQQFAVNGGGLFAGNVSPAATDGLTYQANLTSTIVTATANNQTLIGQQFAPTFSVGSFTGVKTIGADFATNTRFGGNIDLAANNTYSLGSSTNRLANLYSTSANVSGTLTVGTVSGTMTFQSGAGAPTTSNIPAGQAVLWKDTTTGTIKWYANDGGTIKAGPAFN